MVLICSLLSNRKSCITSYYLKMFIHAFHCIWTIIDINWLFEKLPAPSIFAWWYQAQIYCCTNIVKDKTSKLKKIQRAGSWFFFFLQILHTNRQWNLPIKQFCSRYALTNSNTLPQCQIARNPCRHLTICVAPKNCWHWSPGETAKGQKMTFYERHLAILLRGNKNWNGPTLLWTKAALTLWYMVFHLCATVSWIRFSQLSRFMHANWFSDVFREYRNVTLE